MSALTDYLSNAINNGATNDTITYLGTTIPLNYLSGFSQYTDRVRMEDPAAARTFALNPYGGALGQYTNADFVAISDMLQIKAQAYWDAYFPILAQITASTITTTTQIDTALAAFVSAYTGNAAVTGLYSQISAMNSSITAKADASAMTTALAAKASTTAMAAGLARTVTALSGVSIVSVAAAANGVQANSTKAVSVHAMVSLSSTVNISTGSAALSQIVAEVCPTNSATATDWIYASDAKLSQTVSLAIALGLVQADNREIEFDVPAGYYYRLRSVGSGTHTETLVGGQVTTYG